MPEPAVCPEPADAPTYRLTIEAVWPSGSRETYSQDWPYDGNRGRDGDCAIARHALTLGLRALGLLKEGD